MKLERKGNKRYYYDKYKSINMRRDKEKNQKKQKLSQKSGRNQNN